MRKLFVLLFLVSIGFGAMAQEIIRFHQNGNMSNYNLTEGDSIYFNADHSTLYFFNNGVVQSFVSADVDSITFLHDALTSVYVHYDGDLVTITNPLENQGVSITTNGGHVSVSSTSLLSHLNFILSGTTTDGSFKIYSDNPFNLLLNAVNMHNPVGPAINSQSERQMNVVLIENTVSTLSDGTTYNAAPVVGGVAEDQKATLFSEGDIDIIGGGSLTMDSNGAAQHAIASDTDIEIKSGELIIIGATLDAVHASDQLRVKGGNITVASSDDGLSAGGSFEMDCGTLNVTSTGADTKSITSDSLIVISGGLMYVVNSGANSKCLSSSGDVIIEGGEIHLTSSGASVLSALGSGQDVAHPVALSADGSVYVQGGATTIQVTGLGGRGVKADFDFVQSEGTFSITSSGGGVTYTNSTGTLDAYHSTCLKTNGGVELMGGTFVAAASGTGGHGIEADTAITVGDGTSNPSASVTTTGTNITITAGGGGGPGGGSSGNYDEAKAIKTDLSFTQNSGLMTIDSNDDGIKGLQSVVVNDGILDITDSKEGIESPIITVNGGEVRVKSSDDGLNGTAGTGGESNDGSMVTINDGYVFINSSAGDPLDSNGNITVNGGFTVVHGPQSSPEVGIDVNGTALVNGGTIIVSGTNSNMTEGFTAASQQRSLLMKSTSSLAANTIIHLEDSNGNEIFSFKPMRSFYSIVYSGPALTNGATYRLYSGGSHTGTVTDGFITGGAYTAGTLETTFTITSMAQTVNY